MLRFAYLLVAITGIVRVSLAQSGPGVPIEDLFPDGTPTGSIQFTEAIDADQDDGPAETTSNFPVDENPNDGAFGTLFLLSPNQEALSDLSEKSDWVLTGCDPKGLNRQSVAAFCSKSLRATDSGCKHVFAGKAEHTIVRMPKACGKGPFARVHSLAVHPDQTTVLSPADRKRKPEGEVVYQLTFDYDFTAIPEDNGPVFMRVDASDIPGYFDGIVDSPTELGERRIRRAMASQYQIEKRGWWSSLVDWFTEVTTVKSQSDEKRKFTWEDNFDLFSASKDCPGPPEFNASLTINVAGRADFNTAYGFYFEGTLVPPNVNQAFVYFNGDAATSAKFTITGKASITYNSDRFTFFEFGFPGLSVPGIVTVGPSLKLDAYISGSVSLEGSISTGIQYRFPPVNFALGSGANIESAGVQPLAEPDHSIEPTLSVGVTASADAALHIVPTVQLGISVVGGTLIDAQAYVEADLYAGIGLSATSNDGQSPTFCVNPFYGVDLNAGVRGSVLFWDGQVGPYKFYGERFVVESQCFTPFAKREIAAGRRSYTRYDPELDGYAGSKYAQATGGPVKYGSGSLRKRLSLPAIFNCPQSTSYTKLSR